jgi:hypothetical protein
LPGITKKENIYYAHDIPAAALNRREHHGPPGWAVVRHAPLDQVGEQLYLAQLIEQPTD